MVHTISIMDLASARQMLPQTLLEQQNVHKKRDENLLQEQVVNQQIIEMCRDVIRDQGKAQDMVQLSPFATTTDCLPTATSERDDSQAPKIMQLPGKHVAPITPMPPMAPVTPPQTAAHLYLASTTNGETVASDGTPTPSRKRKHATIGYDGDDDSDGDCTRDAQHPQGLVPLFRGNPVTSRPKKRQKSSKATITLRYPYLSEHDMYTTIVLYDGQAVELRCEFCGGNATKEGNLFKGVRGFSQHIRNGHKRTDYTDDDVVRRCGKIFLSPADIARVREKVYKVAVVKTGSKSLPKPVTYSVNHRVEIEDVNGIERLTGDFEVINLESIERSTG